MTEIQLPLVNYCLLFTWQKPYNHCNGKLIAWGHCIIIFCSHDWNSTIIKYCLKPEQLLLLWTIDYLRVFHNYLFLYDFNTTKIPSWKIDCLRLFHYYFLFKWLISIVVSKPNIINLLMNHYLLFTLFQPNNSITWQ